MPYDKSREIETRLTTIVDLVRHGRHSTHSLAKILHVSEPTVSRSLAALRGRGYGIRAIKDGSTWSYEIVKEPCKERGH